MRLCRTALVVSLFVMVGSTPAQEPASSSSGRRLGVFTSQAVPRGVETNAATATGDLGELWLTTGSGFPGAVLRSSSGQPLVLATGGTEALRVFSDGHVSVGAPYNLAPFSVLSYTDGGGALYAHHQTT